MINNNRYAVEAYGSIICNSSFQFALASVNEPIASKEVLAALGSINQCDTRVNMNQQNPSPSRKVASLLLAADLLMLNESITWNMTHRKAICQRLFNTAQPNACRKLELPNKDMPTDF